MRTAVRGLPPSHYNTGNIIDLDDIKDFEASVRSSEWQATNMGGIQAIRVETAISSRNTFALVTAFSEVTVMVPPADDLHFRQHARAVGQKRAIKGWEAVIAKNVARMATVPDDDAKLTQGFVVIEVSNDNSDNIPYIFVFVKGDTRTQDIVLDYNTKAYITVDRDARERMTQAARNAHQGEATDITLIEGATVDPVMREAQRVLLRQAARASP